MLSNEKQKIISPLWYLQINKKISIRTTRPVVYLILFFGALIGIPYILNMNGVYPIDLIVLVSFIFYGIIFVIAVFYWYIALKPYKIKIEEKLAYDFYKIGISLEQLILDINILLYFKSDLLELRNDLKFFYNRRCKKSPEALLRNSINDIISNLLKLNDYRSDLVFNKISKRELSNKFKEIGQNLNDKKEVPAVKAEIVELSGYLKILEKIKFKDKTFPLFSFLRIRFSFSRSWIYCLTLLGTFCIPSIQYLECDNYLIDFSVQKEWNISLAKQLLYF